MNNLLSAINNILLALFPKRCAICGDVIEIKKTICDDCLNIKKIEQPTCEYCGCSKKDCKCKKHKNEFKQIVAPYYYQGNITKSIHRLKFSEMKFLSNQLGKDIAECVLNSYRDIDFDFICFVPLTKRKLNKRGYNQSKLLANVISSVINVKVCECLVKNRKTKDQRKSNYKERKVNLYGAFDVKKDFIQDIDGKIILLVDDVKTTGSTLNECAKMLKLYGAKAVYAASVAIVPKFEK